ncbi:MAG: ankyrin repeat domain-containing protein [Candidatus Dependentiae bacterium]|nr:ankyrin repeat domain-containing protein [Candidatus Dependentiae bacterium]
MEKHYYILIVLLLITSRVSLTMDEQKGLYNLAYSHNSSLLDAIERNSPKEVETALQNGAHANAKNSNGKLAIFVAIANGNQDIIKTLIEWHADIHRKNNKDHTPVHEAIKLERPDIAALLIESGAYNPTKANSTDPQKNQCCSIS